MRAKLPSLPSKPSPTVAATVSRRIIRRPQPPWPVPQPKHAPPHSPDGRPAFTHLPNPTPSRTPISLRLIKLRKRSETLASDARAAAADATERGSVGNAVWSLACLLEDVTMSAVPADGAADARVLRDGRWSLVWLFRNVFSMSPNLAVGILAMTAEFVVRSAELVVECARRVTDYELLIESGEPNSMILSNYAQFLYQYQIDYHRANKHFECSVKAEPADAEALSRYALFLWRQQGDAAAAEEMFLRAITVDPENRYHRSNYLSFLRETGGADTCDPLNSSDVSENEEDDTIAKEVQARSWSDIGILDAAAEKQTPGNDCSTEYIRRKIAYERAIIGGKADSLILSNYAQLLYQYERDLDRADYYFKLAVASEPADAEAMGRYAMFMWQGRGDVEAAEEMFLKAAAADPENSYRWCSYTLFLSETGADDTCYPLDDSGVDTAEGDEDDIDNNNNDEKAATDL